MKEKKVTPLDIMAENQIRKDWKTQSEPSNIVDDYVEQNEKQRREAVENWIKSEKTHLKKVIPQHPLAYLTLSDLISLHGWIDSEADLIETLGGDNTAKLEQAREQMILVHQEIEKRRSMLFGE